MGKDIRPILVSICCLTYNHAKYVEQCIQGILHQDCSFRYEIIINDDCSTDGTINILHQYEKRYPELIKVIYHSENQYQKGVRGFFTKFCFPKAKGKYIALCEGDDYWSNKDKLNIQVEYLENHPHVVYSCHRYSFLVQKTGETGLIKNKYFDNKKNKNKREFTFSVSYPFEKKDWIIKTLTSVFRKECIDYDFINSFKHSRDVHLFYSILKKGLGVCHSFDGGVYRINDGGIFGGKSKYSQSKQNKIVFEELYYHTKEPFFRGYVIRNYARMVKYGGIINNAPHSLIELYSILVYIPCALTKKIFHSFMRIFQR